MPSKAPHFGIQYFVSGDTYSGSIDTFRFSIIDSSMAFISDVIGSGIIDGWNVSVSNNLILSVSKGMGLIGRTIKKNYGGYTKTLVDNNTYYVWMRSRQNAESQISGFSNVAKLSYVDNLAPSTPSGLLVIQANITTIKLKWNKSVELDFSFYEIYRSIDNVNFNLLDTTDSAEYEDSDLNENTLYFYKLKAIDLSNNSSSFSATVASATLIDLTIPPNPRNVTLQIDTTLIHVNWDEPAYSKIGYFNIYVTALDDENRKVKDTEVIKIDKDKNNYTIRNLENDIAYQVDLRSVGVNGIESEGVVQKAVPRFRDGPPGIVELEILDYESMISSSRNGLSLNWSTYPDTYQEFTGNSIITIKEYLSDDYINVSEAITVLSSVTTKSIETFKYQNSNKIFTKAIEPRTKYLISVKNVDAQGRTSIAKTVKHISRNYSNPSPPVNLIVVKETSGDLFLTFSNSTSIFTNNLLTITSLQNNVTQTIVAEVSIGTADSYRLTASKIAENATITFSLRCVDEFNLYSTVSAISYANIIDVESSLPPQPLIYGFAGDKMNTIIWQDKNTDIVVSHKIYRALDVYDLSPSDFVLLEIIPNDIFEYTDYDVSNNTAYAYFVTTVDRRGNESASFITDRFNPQPFITLIPKMRSVLPPVDDLQINLVGQSVEIFWQPTSGIFDGYEIYRSIGNQHSYEFLDIVTSAETYYLDQNILKKTGTYYYIVRKFRNEAELFLTESSAQVSDAIPLSQIKITNGKINIKDISRTIKNFADPIKYETQRILAQHKHDFTTVDKRISLYEANEITDWYTDDNQTFFTFEELTNGVFSSLTLNDVAVSQYGIYYEIDLGLGKITFEIPLALPEGSTSFRDYPFSTVPEIKLRLLDMSETQNTLSEYRIVKINSTQVGSGQFVKNQINRLHHDGRIKEKLLPNFIKLETIDSGYKWYIPTEDQLSIGDARVFYDIININGTDASLLASTSDGIYTSNDYGVSWRLQSYTTTAVSRFFYSSKYQAYFAATNSGLLYSGGATSANFTRWSEVPGAENTKVVRDIAEDSEGTVYITSDLGVYKLIKSAIDNNFFLQQLPIFGPDSTEAYAIIYDGVADRILVSNNLGLFESFDQGENWFFTDEFTEQKEIFKFILVDDYIYALTDFMLFRKKAQDLFFKRVAVFEGASISRNMVYVFNKLFVATDIGLLVSDSSSDIFKDDNITFRYAYSALRYKDKPLPVGSINVINNQLFVGTESQLFLTSEPNKLSLHWQENNKTIPLIRVNGVEQFIGYRYTTSTDYLNRFVCFDVKLEVNDVVEIANNFQVFQAINKGWVEDNFIAAVTLYVDGVSLNTMSLADRPASQLEDLNLPTYNDINSHKVRADYFANKFIQTRDVVVSRNLDDTGSFTSFVSFDKKNVSRMFVYYNRFLSQIYEQIQDAFRMPNFKVLLLNKIAESDVDSFANKYGVFGTYLQYTSNLQVSPGVFGSEITNSKIDDKYISKDDTLSLGLTGGGASIYGGLLDADTTSDVADVTDNQPSDTDGSSTDGRSTVNPVTGGETPLAGG